MQGSRWRNLIERKTFELWKLKVWDLLVQQGLHKALEGKRKMLVGMCNIPNPPEIR
jgi:hypothetical protein